MLSLLFEIHFWTLKNGIYISNNDFGTFKYYDKRDCPKSLSFEKKKIFALERGYQWALSNKRPLKLKQYLRELEEHLETQRIVRIKWICEDTVVLFFNSGITVFINVNLSTGDLINITFDKFLRDKLLSLHISDILLTNMFSVCCYNDPHLTLIYYSKPQFKKFCKKFSDLEPKLVPVTLPGPKGRRLPRKLCANKTGDIIAIWWKYSEDDLFPWSPLVKEVDRANIHVYSITGSKTEILCYHRTEYDLLSVAFSAVDSNVLYVVEQKTSREGAISVENSTFEIVKCSRLQRASIVSISVQSNACCVEFSPDRSNLLLGCVDGSLVLYNQTRALMHIVRTVFVPSVVRWHADGYLVAVASDRGQLQCFDFALSCIKMQSLSEDVTPSGVIDLTVYFSQTGQPQTPLLAEMEWNCKSSKQETDCVAEDSFLLLTFNEGPLVMLRVLSTAVVNPDILVSQYLNADQIDKAINLLLAMDWDTNPESCLSLLKKLTNYIFTSSLSNPSEKYTQIQMALGSFYFPVRPINHSVEMEFYKPIRNISRRLCHYLLRSDLSDLAFGIASHLNEHDLFMDLYYYAKSVDSMSLATSAWERAEKICIEDSAGNISSESESTDCSCSDCSSQSCISETATTNNGDILDERVPSMNTLPSAVRLPSSAPVTAVVGTSQNASLQTHSRNTKSGHVHVDNGGFSLGCRQKVKFSDVVTKITLPEVQEETNHGDVNSTSHHVTQSKSENCGGKPFHISPNSNLHKNIPNNIAQEILKQLDTSDSKILESKSIKVVHFGVV